MVMLSRFLNRQAPHIKTYLGLFVLLNVLILIATYPWIKFFYSGFPLHWDPPSHATKMCWNAHNILNGNFLFPNYNFNMFYPHSYTLAFDEPFWIPSFLFTGIYAISQNLFLSFNITFLVFWAIAGICMYAFLRELSLSRGACYFGAIAFTLMPYRLSYYVEFNMTLCFGLPLCLFFFVRWLKDLKYTSAIFLALSFWLSAVSCIYYTLILLIPLFAILLAHLFRNPSLLLRKKFYFTGMTSSILAGFLCLPYLWPYAALAIKNHYVRTLEEQLHHNAQPLAYLLPSTTNLFHLLIRPTANHCESILFPGITLCLLALLFWLQPRAKSSKYANGLSFLRTSLWIMFWIFIIVVSIANDPQNIEKTFTITTVPALFLIFAISCFLLFLNRNDRGKNHFFGGLGLASLACFILSFGPRLTVGHATGPIHIGNLPIAFLYKYFPIFDVIRVTSRYSIVVLIYVIIAGCSVLNQMVRKYPKQYWIWIVLTSLIVLEALGETVSGSFHFSDYQHFLDSPVQKRLQEIQEPLTIVQLPMGPRDLDVIEMICTARNFPYLINGWGGFLPREHRRLSQLMSSDKSDVEKGSKWLSEVWPEVCLVLDLRGQELWHDIYRKSQLKPEYLYPWWKEIDRDDNYVLYELDRTLTKDSKIIRRVRPDVLRENPILDFHARYRGKKDITMPTTFRVLLNDTEIHRQTLTSGWKRYTIPLPTNFPPRMTGDIVTLELDLSEVSSATKRPSWEVKNIHFKKT